MMTAVTAVFESPLHRAPPETAPASTETAPAVIDRGGFR